MTEQAKSLVKSLAEACDAVGGVEKKGTNATQNYKYVKAADVAKSIRHELFSRGIMLLQDEESIEWAEFMTTNKADPKLPGKVMRECRLRVKFHITNGPETLIMHAYGVAMDSGDKSVYKAKTGALKYFLRGLGLIPDEKDDPEADESVDRAGAKIETEQEFDQRTEDQRGLTQFQVNAIWEAVKRTGKSTDQVSAQLSTLGVKQLEQVMRNQFQALLKWANAPIPVPSNLVPPLKQSVDMANGKKASQKRYAAIFATAAEKGVNEQDVRSYAYENFDVDSMTKLSDQQLGEVLEWVQSVV